MKILYLFLSLWVIFALLGPDPDPRTQINADPCGSGSTTLLDTAYISKTFRRDLMTKQKTNICTFSHYIAMLFHFSNTVGKFSPIVFQQCICGVHHWLRLLCEDWYTVKSTKQVYKTSYMHIGCISETTLFYTAKNNSRIILQSLSIILLGVPYYRLFKNSNILEAFTSQVEISLVVNFTYVAVQVAPKNLLKYLQLPKLLENPPNQEFWAKYVIRTFIPEVKFMNIHFR